MPALCPAVCHSTLHLSWPRAVPRPAWHSSCLLLLPGGFPEQLWCRYFKPQTWLLPGCKLQHAELGGSWWCQGLVLTMSVLPLLTAFYTSKYGYKMCLRVYLNGDGTGRGTHLSLFFVVMKGPNDALLRWPFNQKVGLGQSHCPKMCLLSTHSSFSMPLVWPPWQGGGRTLLC